MTDDDRSKWMEALCEPIYRITREAINSTFQYVEENKDTLKDGLVRIAKDDPDPDAKLCVNNLDVMLLAFIVPELEEAIEKYSLALLGVGAIGSAGGGWDKFYQEWQKAKKTVAAIEATNKLASS